MTGLPPETFERINRGEPAAASSNLSSPASWFVDWATGGGGRGEICVNEFTALNYAALYTCLTLIAGTIAALPCKLYRKRKDGGQDELTDHPVHLLMQREFNANTSSMTGRQAEVGHLLTWGNQYTQIVRTRAGGVSELYPVPPDLVRVDVDGGRLAYYVRDRDTGRENERPLRGKDFLHTPGYSFDAMLGLSPVRVAKTLIRQGIGQDRESERFVTTGMKSPGVLKKKPGFKFDHEAVAYRQRWEQIHNAGGESARAIIIIENDDEWTSLGVNPESAQLLESRKFTRAEIAGLYHVPPHLTGDVEKTTAWGTGIEELNIGFVVYCLLPILRALEQERNRKLFAADEGLFVEHVLAGLLRGDSEKQSRTIRGYVEIGVLTLNEARRMLGFNPLPGGNVIFYPANLIRVDAETGDVIPLPAPEPAALPAKPGATPAEQSPGPPVTLSPAPEPKALPPGPDLRADLLRKLGQDIGRALRKEAAEACKAAKRPAEFVAWIDDFYGRHAEQVRDVYDTALTAGHADRHLARSRADLLTAAECAARDLPDRVARCVERWPTDRVTDTLAELTHAPV